MSPENRIILAVAIALGAFRGSGFKSQSFQAIAHFFVAWLFAAWWFRQPNGRFCFDVAVGLTVLEIVCFIYFAVKKATSTQPNS